MTTNRITSINALRAAFAAPTTPPSLDRTALRLLDAALTDLFDALPESDRDTLDYLIDDFHDDPFHYLDIDLHDDTDADITLDMMRDMIATELRSARDFPADD